MKERVTVANPTRDKSRSPKRGPNKPTPENKSRKRSRAPSRTAPSKNGPDPELDDGQAITFSEKGAPKPMQTSANEQIKGTVNEGNPVRTAVVDLFAGLRTVHLAAKGTGIRIVLSNAAEKCPFANHLARKNNIVETLFEDIQKMDKQWADDFIIECKSKKVDLILVFGGFPCKGLSKVRGNSRENLKNKDSKLFFELTRVLRTVKQANHGHILTKVVVENVLMDKDPESVISEKLGCRATKIGATPVCGATRDRLFWFDFPIAAESGEVLIRGKHQNELRLQKDPQRLAFWDEGWTSHPSFNGHIPTLQGWGSWSQEPPDPRGIKNR